MRQEDSLVYQTSLLSLWAIYFLVSFVVIYGGGKIRKKTKDLKRFALKYPFFQMDFVVIWG